MPPAFSGIILNKETAGVTANAKVQDPKKGPTPLDKEEGLEGYTWRGRGTTRSGDGRKVCAVLIVKPSKPIVHLMMSNHHLSHVPIDSTLHICGDFTLKFTEYLKRNIKRPNDHKTFELGFFCGLPVHIKSKTKIKMLIITSMPIIFASRAQIQVSLDLLSKFLLHRQRPNTFSSPKPIYCLV